MEKYRHPVPETVIHDVSGYDHSAPSELGHVNRGQSSSYPARERARHTGADHADIIRLHEPDTTARQRCEISYAKGKEGEIRGEHVAGVMTALKVTPSPSGLDVAIKALAMTAPSSELAAGRAGLEPGHRFDVDYHGEAWGVFGRHSVDGDEDRIAIDLFLDGEARVPAGPAELESAILATYLQGLIVDNAGSINTGEYVVDINVLYHAAEYPADPDDARAVIISREIDIADLADPEFPGEVDQRLVQAQVFGTASLAELQAVA